LELPPDIKVYKRKDSEWTHKTNADPNTFLFSTNFKTIPEISSEVAVPQEFVGSNPTPHQPFSDSASSIVEDVLIASSTIKMKAEWKS